MRSIACPQMAAPSYLDELEESVIESLREEDPEEYSRIQDLKAQGFIFATAVRFKGAELLTKKDFHESFLTKLRFPAFYGRNMDAWIDVMDDMLRVAWPMSKVCVMYGGSLKIIIEESKLFQESAMCAQLIDCAKFINEERTDYEYLRLLFE
jgi:RNAse (barnase) inhibitor barstar